MVWDVMEVCIPVYILICIYLLLVMEVCIPVCLSVPPACAKFPCCKQFTEAMGEVDKQYKGYPHPQNSPPSRVVIPTLLCSCALPFGLQEFIEQCFLAVFSREYCMSV